jgi:hypothetical protein
MNVPFYFNFLSDYFVGIPQTDPKDSPQNIKNILINIESLIFL